MATTAVPSAFHLRIRVCTPEGEAFAKHRYRLTWGKITWDAVTSDTGLVDHDNLDGSIVAGQLEVGDDVGKDFVPRLTIPIRRVAPPSPPPKAAEGEKAMKLHKFDVTAYALAWRLSNLAFLGRPFVPEFPVSDGFKDFTLYGAVRRYAFKHGLVQKIEPKALPISAVTVTAAAADIVLSHMTHEHDGLK